MRDEFHGAAGEVTGSTDCHGSFEKHPSLVLVHGEDKAREALAGEIGQRDGIEVRLARPGMVLQVWRASRAPAQAGAKPPSLAWLQLRLRPVCLAR